jgi:hypothetical protein
VACGALKHRTGTNRILLPHLHSSTHLKVHLVFVLKTVNPIMNLGESATQTFFFAVLEFELRAYT